MLPAVTQGPLDESLRLVRVEYAQALRAVVRVGARRGMAQPGSVIVHEVAAPVPRVASRPERQRSDVGRSADSRPLVGIFTTLPLGCLGFARQVQEQLAVGRQIAQGFVYPAVEPLPRLEGISVRVPEYELHPIARPAP